MSVNFEEPTSRDFAESPGVVDPTQAYAEDPVTMRPFQVEVDTGIQRIIEANPSGTTMDIAEIRRVCIGGSLPKKDFEQFHATVYVHRQTSHAGKGSYHIWPKPYEEEVTPHVTSSHVSEISDKVVVFDSLDGMLRHWRKAWRNPDRNP